MVAERLEKSFGVDIEKARIAGDTKVKDGKTYVWTEYAPGKFDWQISNKKTPVNSRVVNGNKKQQPTAVKVPKGIKLVDEDSWVEIYDKNGKKVKEEFFADLGFDPDEKWNEKDGNYDIKGGGKMVVTKEHNNREEVKKENKKKFLDYFKDYRYSATVPKTSDDWKKVVGSEVKLRNNKDDKDIKDIMVNGKNIGIVVGNDIFFNDIREKDKRQESEWDLFVKRK